MDFPQANWFRKWERYVGHVQMVRRCFSGGKIQTLCSRGGQNAKMPNGQACDLALDALVKLPEVTRMAGITPSDKTTADHDDATVFVSECAGSSEAMPKARLIYIDEEEGLKGFEIELVDTEQTIGRDAENSARIDSKKISRHHARIYPKNQEWVIEDLKSTNGVFVNDERVKEAVLRHGNIVKFGPLSFRYVLEQPPLAIGPRTAEPDPESDHTHYGGDPGVIERLIQQEETKNVPPKPRLYVPPKIVSEPSSSRSKSAVHTRYLSLGLLAVLMIGGTTYLYSYFRDRVIERQVESYTVNFRRFVDTSESDNVHFLERELVEIRKLATHVDEIASQYPAIDCQGEFADKISACQLRDLQASVLFLAFERWLEALIEDGRIEHAERLVEEVDELLETIRAKQGARIFPEFERELADLLRKPGGQVDKPPEQQLYTVFNNVVVQRVPEELPGGGNAESAYVPSNDEVRELLKLAKIAVEFKRFEKEFPDPTNPGWQRPDKSRLSNLQDKKRELGERMRAKNAVLSGTYKYFKRLVKEVDEKDSNLIDRWSSKSVAP